MAEDATERRIPKVAHRRSTPRLRSAYHRHIILPSPCQVSGAPDPLFRYLTGDGR